MKMFKIGVGVIIVATAMTGWGSVLGLKGSVPHAEFVMGEAIPYTFMIDNHGASVFMVDDFSEDMKNKVEFRMRKRSGEVLQSKEGMPFGEIVVLPDKTETYEADLTQWFTLPPGNYFVQVVVTRGDIVVATPLLAFAIVPGFEIGTLTRAVPGYDTIVRDYTLLYWPREKQEILFLRVTERPSGEMRMLQLGNVVRATDPKVEFMNNSTLVVTHRSSQEVHIRTTIVSERFRFEVLNRERIVRPEKKLPAPEKKK